MLRKEDSTWRTEKAEKVVMEKIDDYITITGAYNKKELGELFLSFISIASDRSTLDEKSKKLLESTLQKIGLKHADFEMLVEEKGDISEDAVKALKDLRITRDMISKAMTKGKEKEIEGSSRDKAARAKEKLEEKASSRKEISQLLRAKGLSESLIKELRENGLTDEYMRLLRALGFTDEDIDDLLKSLQAKREQVGPVKRIDSVASLASSSSDYLSQDGVYLKNSLSKPLSDALREVVLKKPSDPVEYVGHWLLHYKNCEETRTRQQELDQELRIERERFETRDVEDIDVPVEQGEEEGFNEDWNYVNYAGL